MCDQEYKTQLDQLPNHLTNLAHKTAHKIPRFYNTPSAQELEILERFQIGQIGIKLGANFIDTFVPQEQRFVIVSFVPAIDSIPNNDGVYGFLKIRGSHESLEKSRAAARTILETSDSLTPLYIYNSTLPIPLVAKPQADGHDIVNVDMDKMLKKSSSKQLNELRIENEKIQKEIEERKEQLLESVKAPIETDQEYDVARTKTGYHAQQIVKMLAEIEKSKALIKHNHKFIAETDASDPLMLERSIERIRKFDASNGNTPDVSQHMAKTIADRDDFFFNYSQEMCKIWPDFFEQ